MSETFTVDLPSLEGVYASEEIRTTSFDLGTQLLTIDEVRIGWAGAIAEGEGHGDGLEMPLDEWFEWPASFDAVMNPPGAGFWVATVSEGTQDGITFIPFEAEEPFSAVGPATWDFLLDGEGEITLQLSPAFVLGGVMVTPPWGQLSDVYLVVEGTSAGSIPTVSDWGLAMTTLLLLVGGTIVLRRRGVQHTTA
jgi:hypothetical protein